MNESLISKVVDEILAELRVDGSDQLRYEELKGILRDRIIARMFLEIVLALDEQSIKELKKELDESGDTNKLFAKLMETKKITAEYVLQSLLRFKMELTEEIRALISLLTSTQAVVE